MKNLNELKDMQAKSIDLVEIKEGMRVTVGMATCGISAGAGPVLDALKAGVEAKGLNVNVVKTGCIGMCTYEPIVEVFEPGKKKVTYIHVNPEKAAEIVEKHLAGGQPVAEYTVGGSLKTLEELDFYKLQKRVALQNCGLINPEDINEYIARNG